MDQNLRNPSCSILSHAHSCSHSHLDTYPEPWSVTSGAWCRYAPKIKARKQTLINRMSWGINEEYRESPKKTFPELETNILDYKKHVVVFGRPFKPSVPLALAFVLALGSPARRPPAPRCRSPDSPPAPPPPPHSGPGPGARRRRTGPRCGPPRPAAPAPDPGQVGPSRKPKARRKGEVVFVWFPVFGQSFRRGGGLTGARGFGLTGTRGHSSRFWSHRSMWSLKVLRLPRNPAPHLHSRRLLQKRARANLARGRSFSSVGACSGSGLTGAREARPGFSCTHAALHKHARANLARGRSFSSVRARSSLGLTGARERSKSLKIVRLPRNLAPGRTGGDGKHTRSSALAQHCIHTRESVRGGGAGGGGWLKCTHSALHPHTRKRKRTCIHACGGGGGGGWGGMVSTPAQVHPLGTASTHAQKEAHLHPRMRVGGVGGGGGGMVSTPAQAHPLGTASTHAKEEAHLHPRMRVSGFSQVASCCL